MGIMTIGANLKEVFLYVGYHFYYMLGLATQILYDFEVLELTFEWMSWVSTLFQISLVLHVATIVTTGVVHGHYGMISSGDTIYY